MCCNFRRVRTNPWRWKCLRIHWNLTGRHPDIQDRHLPFHKLIFFSPIKIKLMSVISFHLWQNAFNSYSSISLIMSNTVKILLGFFKTLPRRRRLAEHLHSVLESSKEAQSGSSLMCLSVDTDVVIPILSWSRAEWARALSSSLNLWKGSSTTLTLAGFISPRRKWVQTPLHLGHELDLSRQSTKILIYL